MERVLDWDPSTVPTPGPLLLLVATLAAGTLPASHAVAAESIRYDVEIEGVADEALEARILGALRTERFRKDGAPSLALLRRRAAGDAQTVESALRAAGFYEAQAGVEVTLTGEDRARVTVFASPGRPFTLIEHRFEILDPPLSGLLLGAPALGSPVDAPAQASAILAAEAAAVTLLRRRGHPYARFVDRAAEADFSAAELRVASRIEAGPRAVFGPLHIEAEGVDDAYIESYRTWVEGMEFDDASVAAFQRALAATGLFETVVASWPEQPPEAAVSGDAPATLPIVLETTRAKERTIGVGGRFSTDSGPELRLSFEHRNLAGRNQRLLAVAEGGAEDQSLRVEFRQPQFRRSGQDLVAAVVARREASDAFDETALDLSAGLERRLGRLFGGDARLGVGVLGEASFIENASVAGGAEADQTAFLGGLPAFVTIDARDDPLNPTRGFRLRASATPFAGALDGEAVAFLSLDLTGSAYHALDEDARWVLAGRGRTGLIASEALADVPAPRRLFSGGGGSVRGFAERFVGPLDAGGDPIGGRSVIEFGGEIRFKATDSFGLVAFADAGAVSTEFGSIFNEDAQVGVGSGLRYFSPIGPIGVDVAAPLDPRPDDEPFQLYFYIGQAF